MEFRFLRSDVADLRRPFVDPVFRPPGPNSETPETFPRHHAKIGAPSSGLVCEDGAPTPRRLSPRLWHLRKSGNVSPATRFHAGEDARVTIESVLDHRAIIGESPTWDAGEERLFWIDVKAPALHCFAPSTGGARSWALSSDVGGFALMAGNAALVALRQGLYLLDLDTGALRQFAPPPFDPTLFRFNEGACDANGRFWVGVMFDPLEGSPLEQPGLLHSFTLDGGLRPEPDAAELHNGMALSADGGTFFLSHSNRREIIAFDYELDGGRLSHRRVFASIGEGLGIPDGAAVDSDGGYWCALHGGVSVSARPRWGFQAALD
jgi:sugar lactone lactonase YvrE